MGRSLRNYVELRNTNQLEAEYHEYERQCYQSTIQMYERRIEYLEDCQEDEEGSVAKEIQDLKEWIEEFLKYV